MNILLVTQYFPPEICGIAVRVYELANYLTQRGHEITVLTGFPNYPTGIIPDKYKGKSLKIEKINQLKVIRTYIYPSDYSSNLFKRLLNYVSFMLSATSRLSLIDNYDVVISVATPLFAGFPGYLASKIKQAAFVFEIADLWPESIVATGASNNFLLIKFLEILANFFYRKSGRIVVATDGQKKYLINKKGLNAHQIHLVPNAADTDTLTPGPKYNSIRQEFKLGTKFVVLYAGTHGRSHSLETVIEAARILQDSPDIVFFFVGEGEEKTKLIQLREKYLLQNVIFAPLQHRSRMCEVIRTADVSVVPLKKLPLFEGALPTKIFEAMSCGRPIVLSVSGEAAEVVQAANAGICVPPENPEELAQAVLKLYNNPYLAEEYGKSGRSYVVNYFSRKKAADQLEEALIDAVLCKKVGKKTS